MRLRVLVIAQLFLALLPLHAQDSAKEERIGIIAHSYAQSIF
jgi:hypothetical protein